MHPTTPTNPKGYSVEPFDYSVTPEERGNPLDAVSREAFCPACRNGQGRVLNAGEELFGGVCQPCRALFNAKHLAAISGKKKSVRQNSKHDEKIRAEKVFYDEHSQRTRTTADDSGGENLVHQFCAEFAESFESAQQKIQWLAERTGDGLQAEEVLDWQNLVTRGFAALRDYEKNHGDRDMGERCLWLMVGNHYLAGAENLAQLIKLLKRKKQTVVKCLDHFQTLIPELPILPGQRDDEGKKNMKTARENQLPENLGQCEECEK